MPALCRGNGEAFTGGDPIVARHLYKEDLRLFEIQNRWQPITSLRCAMAKGDLEAHPSDSFDVIILQRSEIKAFQS